MKWPIFKDCIINLLKNTRKPKTAALENVVEKLEKLQESKFKDILLVWYKYLHFHI